MHKVPLILTRPAAANAAFIASLPVPLADRLDIVDAPLMDVRPLDASIDMPADAAAVFTSSNGVRFAPASRRRTAYCVGERTTGAARRAGWNAVFAGKNAGELVAHLLSARPSQPLYHLSGRHVRGDVAHRLSNAGLQARNVPLYDQVLLPMDAKASRQLDRQDAVIVPLFSPRSAKHFASFAPFMAQVWAIAISSAVAKELPTNNFRNIETARQPTASSVTQKLKKLVFSNRLG